MYTIFLCLFALIVGAIGHADQDQTPIAGPHKSLWYNALPGDGGTQVGWPRLLWALPANNLARPIPSFLESRLLGV